MPDARFLTLATDPNLIPGIYTGCDQWCHYCPATERCLAFKCQSDSAEPCNPAEDIHRAMFESMKLLKRCYEAEGLEPPAKMLELLGLERVRPEYVPMHDALEHMGKRYAIAATMYLASREQPPPKDPLPKREHGPTPFDVFVFYHVLIATKIYRAITSSLEAARTGSPQARWDADVSAKVALIAIDRSSDALQVMALDERHALIDHLRRHLARLRKDVEARFPAARGLVRPGLDDAARK